jgi:hypothetical protein
MATDLTRNFVPADSKIWKGGARLLTASKTVVLPANPKLEDVISPATFVLQSGWVDIGALSDDGVAIAREWDESEGLLIDQRDFPLRGGQPQNVRMSITATLVYSDLASLDYLWQLGTTTAAAHNNGVLTTPGAPTITVQGTAGTTAYRYIIIAESGGGLSAPGTAGTTATGNATLSATNYNHLSWTPVAGATRYRVYRGGVGSELLLARDITGTTYDDNGTDTPSGAMPAGGTAAPEVAQSRLTMGETKALDEKHVCVLQQSDSPRSGATTFYSLRMFLFRLGVLSPPNGISLSSRAFSRSEFTVRFRPDPAITDGSEYGWIIEQTNT